MAVQDVLLVISAATVAITTIITAVFTGINNSRMRDVKRLQNKSIEKLDVVHESTNGNLSKVQDKLDIAIAEIERLKHALSEIRNRNSTATPVADTIAKQT